MSQILPPRRAVAAVLAGIAAASCLPLPTLARQAPPPQPGPSPAPPAARVPLRDRFAAANTTHDGYLTLAQAEAAGMRGVVRNFAAIDTTRRGAVTLGEIRAFRRARHAGGAAPVGPAAGPPPDQPS